MSESVPLREFLSAEINALREHTDQKFKEAERALEIASRIEGEHFTTLNHEAERVKQIQDNYLLKDAFDVFIKEFRDWKEQLVKEIYDDRAQRIKELNGEIRPLQDQRQFNSGREAKYLAAGIAAGGTLVGIVVKLLTG